MIKSSIKWLLLFSTFLLLLASVLHYPAEAQYNAFKDPTVAKNKKARVETDFVAVENIIKGGRIAVGSKAFIVVLFKNQGIAPVKVHDVNLYPSSTVTSRIALNQCSDAPLSQDSQCAVTVEILGKQGGSYRVELLIEHDGNSRLSTASIMGDIELIAEKRERGERKGVEMFPKVLDFGTSPGGIPISRSVSVTNGSGERIKIKDIFLTMSDRAGFDISHVCPETLGSEENCNVIVTWKPTTKGIAQGVLSLTHTGKKGMASIEIRGDYNPLDKSSDAVIEGNVEFSPEDLDFGDSPGGITMSRLILLNNKTMDAIRIEDISMDVSSKSGFSYKSQCGEELFSGESCVLVVNWKPISRGAAQGVITVKHSGREGVASIEVSGKYSPSDLREEKNIEGGVDLSPEDLDFGISAGEIAMMRPVVVTNNSASNIELWDININASKKSGFSYDSQCFEFLSSGESCIVMVKWAPRVKGLSSGALTVHHSGSAGVANIEISGQYEPEEKSKQEALKGKVEIAPKDLDFGISTGGIAMVRSIVVSNMTLKPVIINNIDITASNKSGFTYKSKCPKVLNVNGSCIITVDWKPEIKGAAQGVLAVSHTGETGMASVEISGKYEPEGKAKKELVGGDVEFSPKALDFGNSAGGITMSRSVILSNKTIDTIKIKEILMDASRKSGFSYKSQCGGVLYSGEDCIVIVSWKPVSKGLAQGVITAFHTGDKGVASIEVSGKYNLVEKIEKKIKKGEVKIAPEKLDFGTSAGGIAMVRPVTITNKTLKPIDIKEIDITTSNKSGFSYKSRCPKTLGVDGSCVVMINWKPEIKGVAQGVLAVHHTGDAGMASVEVSGTYTPEGKAKKELIDGAVKFSSETLDFGTSVGGITMSRSVMLSNKTIDTVKIKNILMDISDKSGFSYKSQCGKELSSGEDCILIVSWNPVTKGLAQGVITALHTGSKGVASIEILGKYEPEEKAEEKAEEGSLNITPEVLDFGTSAGGIAMVRPVVLTNNSKTNIELREVNITASNKSGFNYKSQCSEFLAPKENCVIMVNWKPEVKGLAQGALAVKHSGSTGMASIEILGKYAPEGKAKKELIDGKVELLPKSLDFGTSAGGITMSRSMVLSNKTIDTVKIKNILMDISDKSGFSYKSQCGKELSSGEDCILVVSWKPTSKGLAQGVLAVHHTGDTGTASIEISGTYIPVEKEEKIVEEGNLEIAPEALDFGTSAGGIAMVRPVTITNKTLEPITIKEISVTASNKSGLTYNSKCSRVLGVSESCVVMVNWKPEIKGYAQGVLAVHHTGDTGMASVEISGKYEPEGKAKKELIDGKVELLPKSLNFGISAGGITMSRSVMLSNKTIDTIKIKNILMDISDKSGFSYKSQCGKELSSGKNCILVVSWKPTSKGLAQGVLTVQHTGETGMASIEISGQYNPVETDEEKEGSVEFTPKTLNFGTSAGGITMSRLVLLSNKTMKELKIKNILMNVSDKSGFSYKAQCDEKLAAGENCAFVINWKPTSKGDAQGVITVLHTGKVGVSSIEISGRYEPTETKKEEEGNVEVAPKSLDFGTSAGGIAMVRPIIVSNKTLKPIAIKDVYITASDKSGLSYKSKCPKVLGVDGSCVVMVDWKPEIKGAVQGVLAVHHTGNTRVASIEISGVYNPVETDKDKEGDIEITPKTLAFGTSAGGIAMVRPVTITNKTFNPIAIKDVYITASDKSGLSYKSKCPKVLGVDGSCVVMVDWKPKIKGAVQGVLAVHHTGSSSMASVEVSGIYAPANEGKKEPVDGNVEVAPEILEFGTSAGGIAMVRPIKITNNTLKTVSIKDVYITASDKSGFSYKSKCPKSLGVGEGCVVMIDWDPKVKGASHGVMAVHHTGDTGMVSAEVSGVYEPVELTEEEEQAEGSLEIAPEDLDFGTSVGGLTMVRPVVITNNSKSGIELWDVNISASEKAGFAYESQCFNYLASKESCVVMVSWSPEVRGLAQGALTTHHSGSTGVVSIEIKGQYEPVDSDLEEGNITLFPEELDFGTSAGGVTMVRPITITNKTADAIDIKDIYITASDKVGFSYKSKCPEKLEVGGSCVVMVNWKPSVKGAAQGVLAVHHSGKSKVTTAEIKALLEPQTAENASIYPDTSINKGLLVADRSEIDFGSGIIEESSVVVSLVNSGVSSLSIRKISLAGFGDGIYLSEIGCKVDTELAPGAACPLILNWIPDRIGGIIDSLQIVHDGARGVLVIPVKGTATKVAFGAKSILLKARAAGKKISEYYEEYVHETLGDDSDSFLDDVRNEDGSLNIDKLKKEIAKLEGTKEEKRDEEDKLLANFKITSHSSSRAVLRGSKHSIIVRDGGETVLNGEKWRVAIIPTGVVLINKKKEEVELIFDNTLTRNVEEEEVVVVEDEGSEEELAPGYLDNNIPSDIPPPIGG